MILIEYNSSLIPEGGSAIICGTALLLKAENKDAAGHAFHTKCLEKAGVIGNLPLLELMLTVPLSPGTHVIVPATNSRRPYTHCRPSDYRGTPDEKAEEPDSDESASDNVSQTAGIDDDEKITEG